MERYHLDDGGEGDGDAGQAGGLDDAGADLPEDVPWVQHYAGDVDCETEAEEHDCVDPDDFGEDGKGIELVVKLVQDGRDDGHALGREEPRRGEIPHGQENWPCWLQLFRHV